MHAYLNIAVRAARNAGKLARRAFNGLDPVAWQHKGRNDIVSEIDKAAENLIKDTILQAYPDHEILAEESGLTSGKESVQWLVDPLDGTTNFIHGIPHFAVSIAVAVKGRMEHAVVYDPIKEELFTASRGGGAQLNNHRIRVSAHPELQGALLGTGFPFRHAQRLQEWTAAFSKLMASCADMRRAGSAALDLAYVAAGRLDGFWEFDLNPWDLAAGSLLVSEAGGIVDDMQGSGKYLESGNVLAANPRVFRGLFTQLNAARQ